MKKEVKTNEYFVNVIVSNGEEIKKIKTSYKNVDGNELVKYKKIIFNNGDIAYMQMHMTKDNLMECYLDIVKNKKIYLTNDFTNYYRNIVTLEIESIKNIVLIDIQDIINTGQYIRAEKLYKDTIKNLDLIFKK